MSSARVVRCWVKSRNERCLLYTSVSEHTDALADKNLVYYIIESIDQHADDSWDCKFSKKAAGWSNA